VAVAFGAIGAKAAGTTTVAPAYPTGIAANHVAVAARCAWGAAGAAPGSAAEAGWTQQALLFGGTGTGNDTHTTEVEVDTQILTGSESGTVTFDAATAGGSIAQIVRYSIGAGEAWDLQASSGDDATHGTARSNTSSGNLDLAPGDVLVIVVAIDTDTALTITTGPTVSASGITFGTINRRDSSAGTINGQDGNVEVFDVDVTAGTASGPVTFTYSASATSTCGPMGFLRLRAVAAPTYPFELLTPTPRYF